MAGIDTRSKICGVVEGFYGRPWTFIQRKDLFSRMKSLNINAYLYAPKDDLKHRQMWRELYTEDECSQLQLLIESAKNNNVVFVYAISPGLDITFSNETDVEFIKRKMKQVVCIGCTAFAVLFDDIDPNLNATDKEKYESLAAAQVALINELYQFLNCPEIFLFCPTEYCATRAVPSVKTSEYLITVGSRLVQNIDVMWTGPKVISKSITEESIEELSTVLKRYPVIWDNIHANDYDQKRLFLGPYCGRSGTLLKKLRGVMLNPNCEFEANFVAVHTLASWFNISLSEISNGQLKYDRNVCLELALKSWLKHLYKNTSVLDSGECGAIKKSVTQALMATAVGSLPPSTATIAVAATQVLSSEACAAAVVAVGHKDRETAAEVVLESAAAFAEDGGFGGTRDLSNAACDSMAIVDVVSNPVETIENAIADDDQKGVAAAALAVASVVQHAKQEEAMEICDSEYMHIIQQEMIQSQEAQNNPEGDMENKITEISGSKDDVEMQVDENVPESMDVTLNNNSESDDLLYGENILTVNHLRLLVDLYYLPYEHGFEAVKMLELIHWLRSHAHLVDRNDVEDEEEEDDEVDPDGGDKDGNEGNENVENDVDSNSLGEADIEKEKVVNKPTQWRIKAAEFHERVQQVKDLINIFCCIPNKAVLSDFYSYLQDTRHILESLDSYIKWLESARISYNNVCALRRLLSWCTPGYKEMFTGDDYESWMFRGGLIAEFQRMFPIDNAYDIYPVRSSFIIYNSSDFSVHTLLSEPNQPTQKTGDISLKLPNTKRFSNQLFHLSNQTILRSTSYSVRPYIPHSSDRQALYSLCLNLVSSRACRYMDWQSWTNDSLLATLSGDRYIGPYLEYCPEYCLVLESESGVIIGYAVGTINISGFDEFRLQKYNPYMRLKYSRLIENINTDYKDNFILKIMLNYFIEEKYSIPYSTENSVLLHFNVKEHCRPYDFDTIDSLIRKLLICIISAFKSATAQTNDVNYPATQILSNSTVQNQCQAIAIVTQATILTTTTIPLITIGPVVQLTGRDRTPLISLRLYSNVDGINRSHKEMIKMYGFTELSTATTTMAEVTIQQDTAGEVKPLEVPITDSCQTSHVPDESELLSEIILLSRII